jgi:hypothetical protein
VTSGGATAAFSALVLALGVVMIVETALVDGRLGFLLGGLFVLAGGLRLALALRRR